MIDCDVLAWRIESAGCGVSATQLAYWDQRPSLEEWQKEYARLNAKRHEQEIRMEELAAEEETRAREFRRQLDADRAAALSGSSRRAGKDKSEKGKIRDKSPSKKKKKKGSRSGGSKRHSKKVKSKDSSDGKKSKSKKDSKRSSRSQKKRKLRTTDADSTLSMQRIGEGRWRPLELSWWPEQGALPAKGKEYPSLGYKRLRDKPPKAQQQQQQQQPAEAQ
ncbi:hypothetical protein QJQ45_008239 [Haematococcus lacustris]|nr:hypothetical protein QJQ45_008239 [Haematococcus lacustris]